MSEWTDGAKAYFEKALSAIENRESQASDGGPEFAEDIRIHIETEISEQTLVLVTEDVVRSTLVRVLGYDPLLAERKTAQSSRLSPHLEARIADPFRKTGVIKFFGWAVGVILPLITLLFEFVTGECASGFFDPIPSLWHVALIALVPAGIAWNLQLVGKKRTLERKHLVSLGLVAAVSLYYVIPLAILMPFAVIGIVFFGIGFLPLAPLFSLIVSLALVRKLKLLYPEAQSPWKKAGAGVLLGLALIAIVEAPRYITTYGMAVAESEEPETALRGIRLLRAIGSESVMLDSCLPEFSNQSPLLWVAPRTPPQRAREIFYRVTGREYYLDADKEAAKIKDVGLSGMRSRWDWYQGDQLVGRPVEGLSLRHSRIDAVVEADAAQAYLEWTMEFRNDSGRQGEARALWNLPMGAAVTRVNLWVNGEPEEAAFSAKSKVIAAYKKVVSRRRDPLLVTTKGKGHVLAQCFPIPPAGGEMKIRIGMVVPLHLENRNQGSFVMPSLAARNFEVRDQLRLPVWIDSKTPIYSETLGVPDLTDTIRENLVFSDLQSGPVVVHARRNPETDRFWSVDPYEGGVVRGTVVEAKVVSQDKRWIVVLDSSLGMLKHSKDLLRLLKEQDEAIARVILVDEQHGYQELTNLSELSMEAEGGLDNAPALEAAFRLADKDEALSILWIHGSQSRELSSSEGLHRQLTRRSNRTAIYSLSCEPGVNAVLSALESNVEIRSVLRASPSATADLKNFFEDQADGATQVVVVYDREVAKEFGDGLQVSDHAARLWALREAKRIFYSRENEAYERSAKLAAQHQLVTPASGAVVLENSTQYEEAGLNPVEKGTTASIPDTGTSLWLLAGGLGVLWFVRRRVARQ